jgi:hypothetical protein
MSNTKLSIKDQLVDSSRTVIELVSAGIGNNTELFGETMEIAFREKQPVSSRAARVIQLCVERNRNLVLPYLNTIIFDMPEDEGPRRSFLKILADLRYEYNEDQKGILTNLCFDWIQSVDQSVAIKVYCMQILAKIAASEPDLKPELISVIEEQIPKGSAGIRAQGKKILKKLYNSQKHL